MNFGWLVDHVDTQIAFWLLGFVVPAATAAPSGRLLVRRFVMRGGLTPFAACTSA